MQTERLVELVQEHCRVEYLPWPIPELRFHPTRKWKFDYAWLVPQIAMEIQGGIWTGGRHSRGKGQKDDMEKLSVAATMGWTVLQVTPAQIKDKSWVGLFTDSFDSWICRIVPWLPEDRVRLPNHARKGKE